MELEEAIKHCHEKAEELRHEVETWVHCPNDPNWRKDLKDFDDCKKCAEEHEQLAEWLEELKAYRECGSIQDACADCDGCNNSRNTW